MVKLLASSALACVLLISIVTPAHASGVADPGSDNAIAILQETVPQILTGTDTGNTQTTIKSFNGALTASETSPSGVKNDVSIGVIDGHNPTLTSSGLVTMSTLDSESGQVYQPLVAGFRILNIQKSPLSQDSFSFKLDIPDGSHLESALGGVVVVLSDGTLVGSLKTPWAVDANGTSVPTSYEILAGNTVVQHVDVPNDAAYPVVSDPNWSYIYSYSIGVSPKTAWDKLHRCFNCYFPVRGAPSSFPAYNQLLPLQVEIPPNSGIAYLMNFECRMGSTYVATDQYSWQFLATKNHVDGLGSYIFFQLKNVGGSPFLFVDAFIVNDFLLGNAIYAQGAKDNWQVFANNLGM